MYIRPQKQCLVIFKKGSTCMAISDLACSFTKKHIGMETSLASCWLTLLPLQPSASFFFSSKSSGTGTCNRNRLMTVTKIQLILYLWCYTISNKTKLWFITEVYYELQDICYITMCIAFIILLQRHTKDLDTVYEVLTNSISNNYWKWISIKRYVFKL